MPRRVVPAPSSVGVAVYDASCLFGKHVRYLLLGFGVRHVVRPRWSRELLGEAAGAMGRHLRGDALEDFGRWLRAEADVVRGGLVGGYKRWLDAVDLPDPDDRHVVATAIACGATWVVTANLRDFPPAVLAPLGIAAVTPDAFALACLDANPVAAVRIVQDHPDPARLLRHLDRDLPATAAALRRLT